ncbi:uncharacterized protein LOC111350103 isoform X2 [Spodoptera litura]|uniref:Uncharacterized protein LOC111350103 isoform X1 n=1 Tax=Spodoptera litura TaxID=69820 RepID=A0A9J7DRV8_SPOLT|nr:uncharacterized protein LOC111350103 isoform X1 [Spodoptera litura]XP_022817315.1 uncharacterized protein LOC111350103 isoform X2 [Spodoptera litura]
MQLSHLALCLALISTSALSQNLPLNEIIFLETMLPKNPGQSIKNTMDSISNMVRSNMPIKVNRRYAIIGNTPRTVNQNHQKTVLIQNMDTVSPKTILFRNGVDTVPRRVIVRNNDLPAKIMIDNNDASLRMVHRKAPEQQIVLVQPEFSQNKVLVRDNLLMSGPSSVLSPVPMMSGGLPSAAPQPRGKLSRKFPIPPPTL